MTIMSWAVQRKRLHRDLVGQHNPSAARCPSTRNKDPRGMVSWFAFPVEKARSTEQHLSNSQAVAHAVSLARRQERHHIYIYIILYICRCLSLRLSFQEDYNHFGWVPQQQDIHIGRLQRNWVLFGQDWPCCEGWYPCRIRAQDGPHSINMCHSIDSKASPIVLFRTPLFSVWLGPFSGQKDPWKEWGTYDIVTK